MAGRGNRDEFGESFDNAENDSGRPGCQDLTVRFVILAVYCGLRLLIVYGKIMQGMLTIKVDPLFSSEENKVSDFSD